MVEKPNLQYLKKSAKAFKRALSLHDEEAKKRYFAVFENLQEPVKLADCLHVIALEQGYDSWPKLKFFVEATAMERTERVQQMVGALFYGQFYRIDRLLEIDDTLGDAHLGIQAALYKKDAVFKALEQDPSLVSKKIGTRSLFLHLCYSKYFQKHPDKIDDMLAIAERMIALGADVNDSFPWGDGSPLSALYGALGHANNLKLAELLLQNGANPDDGECLYHACELGHLEGLKLLMQYGVDTKANHHWIRMLDFDNYEGAKLLLEYGAPANPVRDDGTSLSSLHHAIKRGRDARFADLLLSHGADVQTIEDGHSVYGFSYIYNNQSICDFLKGQQFDTSLTVEERFVGAIMRADYDTALEVMNTVDGIIEALGDKDLAIPTSLATTPGNLNVFETMSRLGIDLNTVCDEYGMPILHIASWHGQAEYVSYFLKSGPDLEIENQFGGTALGTVIHGSQHCPDRQRGNYVACAELLLDAGALIRRDHGHFTMGSEEMSDFLEIRERN